MLNPPSKIIVNLRGATKRMQKVDTVLGEQSVLLFSEAVARILRHIEVEDGCVNKIVFQNLGAEVCLLLLSASSEYETAWNALRLANTPAVYRQTRVASELIALAILLVLPDKEVRNLPSKLQFVQKLKNNPQKGVVDLYKTSMKQQGRKSIRVEPELKGNMIYPAFLEASKRILRAPKEIIENLDLFRKEIQHPASHGSMEVYLYHFEGFSGNRAGATFKEERADTYQKAATDIINLVNCHAEALDQTYNYLKNYQQE